MQHKLEGCRFARLEFVVDDDEVGLDENDVPQVTVEELAVGFGRIAGNVVPFRCRDKVDDPAVRGGSVPGLLLAVNQDRIVGAGAVRPLVVKLAAVQIAVDAGRQQRLAVGV